MKKVLLGIAIIMAAGIATPSFAHEGHGKKVKKHATATKYTCTMHPEVVKDKPGKCPKCGMTLVAMKTESKK